MEIQMLARSSFPNFNGAIKRYNQDKNLYTIRRRSKEFFSAPGPGN